MIIFIYIYVYTTYEANMLHIHISACTVHTEQLLNQASHAMHSSLVALSEIV